MFAQDAKLSNSIQGAGSLLYLIDNKVYFETICTKEHVGIMNRFRSVAVITFASQAKGHRFDPGRNHFVVFVDDLPHLEIILK